MTFVDWKITISERKTEIIFNHCSIGLSFRRLRGSSGQTPANHDKSHYPQMEKPCNSGEQWATKKLKNFEVKSKCTSLGSVFRPGDVPGN